VGITKEKLMVVHYFDLSGNFIAFRRSPADRFLFDKHGHWLGWFPWNDDDAVGKNGRYLGTVRRNRLVWMSKPYRGYPGYPGYPGYAGYPGYPGYAGYAGYIPGVRDITLSDVA
jgi:hypothetical protein